MKWDKVVVDVDVDSVVDAMITDIDAEVVVSHIVVVVIDVVDVQL
jgi:hypothetical protein